MNTFRSEWRKLVSVRMWIGLTLAAVLFTALNAIVIVIFIGNDLGEGEALGPPLDITALYATIGSASVLALILGILSMTSEYRHQTITTTLLATPRRGRLVVAKMAASALLAAGIAAACVVTTLLIMGVGMIFKELGSVDAGEIAAIGAGAVLGFAVYAVLGVGFGSLVRNQIAAIVAALVWAMLVESLIVAFWPQYGRWLPGGALSGVLQAESTGYDYFGVLPSALLLVAYAAGFAAIAVRTTLRRDIT